MNKHFLNVEISESATTVKNYEFLIDYKNVKGIATGIGHSPVPGMINAGAGSRLSVTECLTNMVFAPLTHGLKGVSLSANWMWPVVITKEP